MLCFKPGFTELTRICFGASSSAVHLYKVYLKHDCTMYMYTSPTGL